MSPDELSMKTGPAVKLLGALANEKRLMIMSYLFEGEKSVNTLAAQVKLSQSALSQHLAKLRALGLVQTRRDGQTIYYKSQSKEAMAVVDSWQFVFQVLTIDYFCWNTSNYNI